MKISMDATEPYVTKDDSLIQEIIHPAFQEGAKMSLAQATINPGCSTRLHVHHTSQEIYHVTSGQGLMTLDREEFPVGQDDTVLIMPGIPHRIENTGDSPLVFLCCCAPPYDHGDMELR